MTEENVSTQYHGNHCPKCEGEISHLATRFKEIKIPIAYFKCPECKEHLYARKEGKFFAVGSMKQ